MSAYLYPGVVVAERVGWGYGAESMYVHQSEVGYGINAAGRASGHSTLVAQELP